MASVRNIVSGITGGAAEVGRSVHARREELMRGGLDKLWQLRFHDDRVFLVNISRDIEVQEAWYTNATGERQALGPIRVGEHSELRALRDTDATDERGGRVQWRVRSMLLPWVSIHREGSLAEVPVAHSSAN